MHDVAEVLEHAEHSAERSSLLSFEFVALKCLDLQGRRSRRRDAAASDAQTDTKERDARSFHGLSLSELAAAAAKVGYDLVRVELDDQSHRALGLFEPGSFGRAAEQDDRPVVTERGGLCDRGLALIGPDFLVRAVDRSDVRRAEALQHLRLRRFTHMQVELHVAVGQITVLAYVLRRRWVLNAAHAQGRSESRYRQESGRHRSILSSRDGPRC